MPAGQGKRDAIRPRHDLIPVEFLDELAEIFAEGRRPRPGLPEGYGDSWKNGGDDFLRDCLNHASNHLHKYMNGDRSENHLAKVAWNALAVRWHYAKLPSKTNCPCWIYDKYVGPVINCPLHGSSSSTPYDGGGKHGCMGPNSPTPQPVALTEVQTGHSES
jgi:Domain of unknown function (DUF5664)